MNKAERWGKSSINLRAALIRSIEVYRKSWLVAESEKLRAEGEYMQRLVANCLEHETPSQHTAAMLLYARDIYSILRAGWRISRHCSCLAHSAYLCLDGEASLSGVNCVLETGTPSTVVRRTARLKVIKFHTPAPESFVGPSVRSLQTAAATVAEMAELRTPSKFNRDAPAPLTEHAWHVQPGTQSSGLTGSDHQVLPADSSGQMVEMQWEHICSAFQQTRDLRIRAPTDNPQMELSLPLPLVETSLEWTPATTVLFAKHFLSNRDETRDWIAADIASVLTAYDTSPWLSLSLSERHGAFCFLTERQSLHDGRARPYLIGHLHGTGATSTQQQSPSFT